MESHKQGGAASSKPVVADLDARLHAMRLGDPPSSRQQGRYPPLTTPLLLPTATPAVRPLLHPSQVFVPTATPVVRPPPLSPPQPQPQVLVPTESIDVRLLQQLQVARQYWPQSQPQLPSYGGGESSPGAGYASPVGAGSPSSIVAPLYGKHSPRFNVPAAPFLPVASKPSKLSPSARDYHPIAASHPSVAQSSSTPSSGASQCLPQPGAAVASSAWHDNASLDPYASAVQSALRANQGDSRCWNHAPAIGRLPALDGVQARLLRTPMNRAHATSAEPSEHVARLLAERGEEVRLRVLAVVKRAVHGVMGSREGHVVFLALLRACEGRFHELQCIVKSACDGEGSLMHVAKQDHGERALKELIRAVAPYPQLCQPLIICLLRERLMEQCKGPQLLQHCFTTLPYNECSIIIRFAIAIISEILGSAVGSRCLAVCFEHARHGELRALEMIILTHTSAIAKGEHSNLFLQRVLECGSELLKQGIAERVAQDVFSLSADRIGSFVVEACFLQTGSLPPLQSVLAAFLGLRDDQLAELVKGDYANYVVSKLLTAGKYPFPEQTMELAQRINKLPAAVVKDLSATQVMKAVEKLLPKRL